MRIKMIKCIVIAIVICGVLNAEYFPKQMRAPKPEQKENEKNMQPPIQNIQPPIQKIQPPIQKIQPPIQNGKPTMQNGKPTMQNGKPPIQNIQSIQPIQNEKPTIQNGKPPMQNGKPPMQNMQPIQNEKPTMQNGKPPMQTPIQQEKQKNEGKPMPEEPQNNFICVSTPFCDFYQVTSDLNDYGCSKCTSGYSLQINTNGAGICSQKSIIYHCLWETHNPAADLSFCQLCEKNFAIDMSALSCSYESSVRVPYCFSYRRVIINSTLTAICARCNDNYTLVADTDGITSCEPKCNIENCKTCIRENDTDLCLRCAFGTIGVSDSTSGHYEKCLSCSQWQNELLTPALRADGN